MKPGRGTGGVENIHALGQQAKCHARQHVARAGGGQVGRPGGVDDGPGIPPGILPAVRRCDHRIGALEQHHRARPLGGVPCPRQLVALYGEKSFEFALVGSQEARPLGGLEQAIGVVGENAQPVGIDDRRLPRLKGGKDFGTGIGRYPGAGPDENGVYSGIAQQVAEPGDVFDRLDQRPRLFGGIDGERVGRRSDGDQPGARTPGPHRRQPGGAGHFRSADDDGVATGVFVGFGVRPREPGDPKLGSVDPGPGADSGQYGFGNADVGDHQIAGKPAARQ